MQLKLLLFLLIPLTLAAQTPPQLQSQIQALTAFRLSLNDPLSSLANWNPSSPSAPCSWRGILCSNTNTTVTELRLPRLHLSGHISPQLSSLPQLRKLSLHSNSLSGPIPNLFNLTNLVLFNVANNLLSGFVPASLPASLRYLDLSDNVLTGFIPANLSAALPGLQFLNLANNRLHGTIPGDFGRLSTLMHLWLDGNQLEGTIPAVLANCTSLVHVSIQSNALRGIVPCAVAQLPRLQVLSLAHNRLSGSVPSCVFDDSPSLRIVELGYNEFTELEKPNGELNNGSLIQVFDIQENRIEGQFPVWLASASGFTVLDLSGNAFSGSLSADIGKFTALQELRLSRNSFSGAVPAEIVRCGALQVLDLEWNRFSGDIMVVLARLSHLRDVYLGSNVFSGSLTASVGKLTELVTLSVFNNGLVGSLPAELMRLSNLSVLDLSGNNLSGLFPANLGDLVALQALNLSKNSFTGSIPASIGSLVDLKILDFSGQKNLSGDLPAELFGLPSLEIVSLAENLFSGPVPEGFSSLWNLRDLNLSNNLFRGTIPSTYGYLQSLQVLSLSNNDISDDIPVELANCLNLTVIELRSNKLSGVIPAEISRLSKLINLDLGQNTLSGKIPPQLSNCSALVTLKLDGNHLSGDIPDSLSNLSKLEVLDLSSNSLSGSIPSQLARISGLVYFNVSNNDLSGKIPVMLSSRFDNPAAYSDNPDLCGQPLEDCHNRKRRYLILVICIIVAAALLLLLLCCCIAFGLIRWRRRFLESREGGKKRSPGRGSGSSTGSGENNGGPKLVMFSSRISYAETIEATRQFDEENVLRRGRHGLLFKACYNDGTVLSILRLPSTSADGAVVIEEGSFRKEAESLGKLKHRNLTVLRGYYAGPPPDVRLLVFDYMPNGNLATLLQEASHQEGQVLNWPMRHLIALGVARGLAFLHSSSVIHGDIKPLNILFDADFEPHLSDFGLVSMVVTAGAAEAAAIAASTSATQVGSLGYVAPDAAAAGHATREGDVYSFGIVLLELLTGRRPGMFTGEEEDIVKWVKRQLQRGQVSELLEPGFLELDPESSEWEEFLLGIKVGLLCVENRRTRKQHTITNQLQKNKRHKI